MKKLDRFLIKSFLGPFIATFLIVMFILIMQFLWLYIDELVGKGLGLGVILEFLGWGCCTILPTALPLAVLLASMMTLGNLGENNELLAIKAAGVSLARMLIPLSVIAVLISIGAFFASNNLIPVAYNKIFTLRNDILRTKNEIKIPEKNFYDGIDGYVLRIEDRDESGMMHGVMVYNHTSNKGNVSMTLADSAIMKLSDNKQFLTFELFDGVNYEETNTKKYRDTTLQLQRIEFAHQEMVISLQNYAFQKSDAGEFKDEIKCLKLGQLEHSKDSLGLENNTLSNSHIHSFLNCYQLAYAKQLDTTFKSGIRYDFAPEGLGKWDNIEDEINAYYKAASQADEMVSSLSSYGRESFQYNYLLRRIDEGIFKKFALALACFIFFFIGAPIGALIRKGGLGTPAIISVLFFVLYWVIDVTGTKLARDGAVDSFSGVFISSFVLLPIGVYLTWKAINDSSIFNLDNMKAIFRHIKRKVVSLFHKTRIVYMGTPEFAIAPLEELRRNKYKIVAVVTVPDKASGRGLKVNESAVKKYAVEHGIPVYQPEKMKDPEFIEAMKALKPDLFVVVAFRILPKVVWEIPKMGTFNLHAALLPQYRGAAPINWAIINGDNVSGVTSFMIDDGIDTGKIMIREQVRISEDDTAGDLHDRLMQVGSKVVLQTVEGIIENDIEYRLQKTFIQGDEQLRPAPKLTKELCHIKWNDSSRNIRNLIRGLSPYPAAYADLDKDGTVTSMKIFKASYADLDSLRAHGTASASAEKGYEPGTVISDGKSFMAIATADGALYIDELQLAGKKRMDVKTFLLGFRDPESYKAI